MKQWALTICISCVLAGGLELLLPKKEYAKSIKSVLALYILVSVLRPVTDTSKFVFDLSSMQNSTAVVDYSEYQAELECKALKQSLEEQLSAQGMDGSVTVELGPPLTITAVTESPEQTNEILTKALQDCQPVVINIEDASNET